MSYHGDTGTGRTNDDLSSLKDVDKPFGGNTGFPTIAGVESGLSATSLRRRAVQIAIPGRFCHTVGIEGCSPFPAAFPMQGCSTAPGLSPRLVATGQAERAQARESLPVTRTAQQRLATPEGSFAPKPDAVPCEHQPIAIPIEFSCDGTGMCVMMPHGFNRQTVALRPAVRRITGVRIAHDARGTCPV